jgi:exodeoxyribonuclease-5
MVNRYFIEKIKENFAFDLTADQYAAIAKIVDFLYSRSNNQLFLLKGYAGTGKSSLIGSLVRTMSQFNQKTVLMAPTGRAAKVFSAYAGQPAFTVHKKIYRMDKFTEGPGVFSLAENRHRQTLFLVDEASMISNDNREFSIFGSGRLLDDLIEYVYSGDGNRLLLIGDTAQLPPVQQEFSPALDEQTISSYLLEVVSCTLTEIVRQSENSGILMNATLLRNTLRNNDTKRFPKINLHAFNDVMRISGTELIEEISSAYHRDGIEETIVISRSNKRVNAYNNGIRNRVLYREEELSPGDLLMITKNNYHWAGGIEDIDFLANGEFVEVVRVRRQETMYGFRFCNVLLRHNDYGVEFEAKINLDSLHTEVPGLTREQSDQLFTAVMEDYADISRKSARYKKVKENPYFNALLVKYGYAVTCHKAQGGEWKNVFLDLGYLNESHMGDNFYRWLYTSITRSSQMLYLVNLPNDFIEPNK